MVNHQNGQISALPKYMQSGVNTHACVHGKGKNPQSLVFLLENM